MKYLKYFESEQDGPQIGDYVICQEIDHENIDKLNMFLSNNIGQIVAYDLANLYTSYPLIVKYENIPDDLYDFFSAIEFYDDCRYFDFKDVLAYSKIKEDLKYMINANKHNM